LPSRLATRFDEPLQPRVRLARNTQSRQLTAPQRHHLPAGYRQVGLALLAVTPAMLRAVLRFDDVVESPLRRFAKFGIARHAIRFAERERRDAMAVEPKLRGRVASLREDVAPLPLLLHQIVEAPLNRTLVLVAEVIVTRPQERQQRKPRDRAVGFHRRELGRIDR